MKGFLFMLSFMTRLPVGSSHDFREEDFVWGIRLMPLVGLVIGLILYLVAQLRLVFHQDVASIILWAVYLWVTGGLHFDGLGDTIDGVCSYRSREQILEIMKDSRLGTFGGLGLLLVLISNITLTKYLDARVLLLMPVVGRCAGVVAASLSKYARTEGMGKVFVEQADGRTVLLNLVVTSLFCLIAYPLGLVGMCGALAATLLITRKINKVLGGMTGDTIGFVIEFSQTCFLFTLYWRMLP
ncbi:MAG: adenosylcobinamide-GDP ribazoletransferase [Limnochordia bacterium]|jgi:adenosylcobinamide-GDP ribazoletransferase|nr:adenosylcobinamide-GDP ribazoletransferase [Limnochordia bacterium]MDD2630068.1 adenosylcobinamide-GDP ribazoletransferase [Limnochordia bacterium]